MTKRVAVIGSNSFSGSHFVRHALEQGMEVVGISRSPEPIAAFLAYGWGEESTAGGQFLFHQLDLNRHPAQICDVITSFQPNYVVNFAAQSMVAESWKHPDQWYQTNVVANVRLHDGLRKMPFIEKYVHISTPEVYGSCTGTVTEDAPMNPSTPYAVSRAACDMHLLSFHRNYGFPVVFTRAANVFGPGQQLYRIIPRTILCARLVRELQLHGGGRSVRSFIHIRDVVEGTLRVMRSAEPPNIYHLSTARHVSIRDLVDMICRELGVDFGSVVTVVGERPGKDAAYLLDSTKARESLGWRDEISLESGISETIQWIDRNLEQLRTQPADYIHRP